MHFQENTRKLHEDLRVLVLEQKADIEALHKRDTESQKAISILETRLKDHEDQLAKRPSIDDHSAELEVLKAEHTSLKDFLKESSEKETKEKKEREEKHAKDLSDLTEKLKTSNQRIKTLVSKSKAYETEAENIDKMIFPCLGFEWPPESPLSRTEAYEEARNSIDDLFEACRGIAKSLSLKRACTTLIDRMTKLMRVVPELIRDWQESSARGAASIALAMCKAHFPTMSFASITCGVPKGTNIKAALSETKGYDMLFARRVDHSFWYKKNVPPPSFSDDEEDEDEEGAEEGSGSSTHRSDEDSGEGSGKDDTYQASEEDGQSSE